MYAFATKNFRLDSTQFNDNTPFIPRLKISLGIIEKVDIRHPEHRGRHSDLLSKRLESWKKALEVVSSIFRIESSLFIVIVSIFYKKDYLLNLVIVLRGPKK